MSSLGSKVQQVLNEPGCATNQAKPSFDRKKGCNRMLAPGAAAGGCAFDGAKIALQPITDVVHLFMGLSIVKDTPGMAEAPSRRDQAFIALALPRR